MSHECRHIMPNGSKCKAAALTGKPYCYFHTRVHRFTSMSPVPPKGTLRLPIIEDRSAIQIALAQIFDALGATCPIPGPPPSLSEDEDSPTKRDRERRVDCPRPRPFR